MTRKYVFFDIDNTLVSHVGGSHIPPETREALRLLKEKGHVPAIATGRGAFLTRSVAEDLEIDLLVCADGAQILNKGEPLETTWLPQEALPSFRETAKKYPALAAAIDERCIYTLNDTGEFEAYFSAQAGYPCVRSLHKMERALLCYLLLPPPLPEGCGIFSHPPKGVTLEPMKRFVEARAAGTSKWRGIELALGRLGAGPQDVVAFGDGSNDVEMLRRAPTSVAVGGAAADVKEAATHVADDIDEGGILMACVALGLI